MVKPIPELVSNGQYRQALSCYAQAHASSLRPNNFTFPFLLKSCGKLKSISEAQQLHTQIVKSGFQFDRYSATALIDAYMKLQLFGDALELFDGIPEPTVPSFNAIIAGFSQCGRFKESICAFMRIATEGLRPNSVTVASVLPACRVVEEGLQLHGFSTKMGHDLDRHVATALVTMYSNCSQLGLAQKVFEFISDKKVESYNAMISGFLINEAYFMALDLVRQMMICSSQESNSSTWLSVFSVCSSLSALLLGKQVHCYLLKHEVSHDVKLGTTLVDMYSKCGSLRWAYQVFTGMEKRSLTTWNAMISGLLNHGHLGTGAELFQQLRLEGLEPDTVTWNLMINGFSRQGKLAESFAFFTKMQSEGAMRPSLESITSLLQVCSSMLDLHHGKEIYGHVIRTRENFSDEVFQTTMIHMYMKCGYYVHARRVFDRIGTKSSDPAMWNAMISGYGSNGKNELALQFFTEMLERRIRPNSATFLTVLSVCSHSGLVRKGWDIFHMMTSAYNINPTTEHFACMVDLLGRAGKLSEAWDLLTEVPNPPASLYYSLLGACRSYSNADLAEEIAKRLCHLDPISPTPLVILSNIYAGKDRWNDVERLRKTMVDKRLYKVPGCSWIGTKASCSSP
ncbi:pentatricopeptide repeat-containing protein At2g02750 [Typha angustifolia]|uniref:pentatricopeptide repeat-containing protein At2g02750 n=1 Tax=Typha angustifolia TaxID=59011 RepID=UPI003C2CC3AE